MIVKVCGMREEGNILELIRDASPDLMGMIFYDQSPRFVIREGMDMNFYKTLEVQKVGVFVNSTLEYILQQINDFALDYVQLHGDETLDFVRVLMSSSPVRIIKVVRVGDSVDWQELAKWEELVDLFLFDTQTEKFGGSGTQFDWSVLERYPLNTNFLLSGGVNSGSWNTVQAMTVKCPQLIGLDINSKFEREPGIKDVDKIKSFIKECRGSVI